MNFGMRFFFDERGLMVLEQGNGGVIDEKEEFYMQKGKG